MCKALLFLSWLLNIDATYTSPVPTPEGRDITLSMALWWLSVWLHTPCPSIYGFLWLPSKNTNKALPSLLPHAPFLHCCMNFGSGGTRLWKIPWVEVWGFHRSVENYELSLNICHKEAQFLCFIGIPFSFISHTLQAFLCVAHKNKQTVSVIHLILESFHTFYQGLSHFWIYHYFFQLLKPPIACHLGWFPDKR